MNNEIRKNLLNLKVTAEGFFKNYHQPIDEQVLAELLQMYQADLDPQYHPAIIKELCAEYKCNFEALSRQVFQKSVFSNPERLSRLLDTYKPSYYKVIEKDPSYRLAAGLTQHMRSNISAFAQKHEIQLDSLQRIYVQGLKEMHTEHRFYPDANFTLRVTYGKVDDYFPMDAVHYNYFTTIEGIMEKENPDIYDYVVEERLKELYRTKDYGRYAAPDGTLRVCFIASNHTTGGNSGSPVLNADGHLVGINFDRNWEGTMSDLMYDPDMCRNISLDIRYCLFIVDKFAGAGHLLNEMRIVD